MAIDLFIPTKFNAEKERFTSSKGNIKIDYRDTTNIVEPYLLSTPYRPWVGGAALNVASLVVISDPHITGDQTDYRRFGLDLMFQVSDYQTNTLFLLADAKLFEVQYNETEFVKDDLDMFLKHNYTITETNFEQSISSSTLVYPLNLETSEITSGMVDKIPTVIFKKNNSVFTGRSSLDTIIGDLGESIYTINYKEDTDTDHGDSGTIIDPSLVSDAIKNLVMFSSDSSQPAFKANLHLVSSFTNTGTALVTSNPSVLTDTNPNYTLYSKTIVTDPDVVGFTINLSPELGILFHLTVETDLQDLTEEEIGESLLYFHPVYTGQLASEFGLVKVTLPTTPEAINITVNETLTPLGEFGESDFTKLIEALQNVLSPLNINALECENDCLLIDNRSLEDYEITISSESTAFILKPVFTSFKFPNKGTEDIYSAAYHKSNYSFTHIPSQLEETPSLLEYKFKLTKNTRSELKYLDNAFNLVIKAAQIEVGEIELPIKIDDVDTPLTATIAPEDTTVEAILSKLKEAFETALGVDFGVVANNLTSTITINNLSTTNNKIISLGKAVWYSVDAKNGVLQNTSTDMFKVNLLTASGG